MTISKPITLDTLAGMIKRGFDDVDRRFDRLETRVGGLETRIDKLEARVDNLDVKVDFRFNALQNRLDSMALNYVTIQQHGRLQVRVDKLEKGRRR